MKIQCACGAKYAFEVTPEMLRKPVQFICQNCGLDSSELVNELIRQELAQAAPEAPASADASASAMAEPPPPPPSTSAPPPPRVALRTSAVSQPAAAAPNDPQLCSKHPGQIATQRCHICQKPICPKCMELFGYVCSPLCKARADSHGIEVPLYAGQKSVIERRHWHRVGLAAAGICLILAALGGVWFWFEFYGSRPRVAFSVRFAEPSYGGLTKMCGQDQLLFLHGGTLARCDLKARKQVWSRELIDPKVVETEAVAELKDLELARSRQPPEDRLTPPTLEKVRASVQEALVRQLQLLVRSQMVWVANADKLVRYDWDTGNPVQEIPFNRGFDEPLSRGDELLFMEDTMQGSAKVTYLNLATGQTRVEPIGEVAPGALATTANPPALAGNPTGTGARAQVARRTPMGGLPVGRPGADAGKPLDPAKVAEQAQRLPAPERIALPAVLAANANQERALAELQDNPTRRPGQSAAARREPAEVFRLIPANNGFVQFATRLLESRIVERSAMKPPPKKSALNAETSVANTDAVANELLNEMQRNRGGDSVQEDLSRYRVTVRLPEAKQVADWSGEVVGPPALFPLKTVNVVAAGKTIIVLDRTNKKLWGSTLSFNMEKYGSLEPGEAPFGQGPCVEREGVLYLFDQGVLTAFDLSNGNPRWRLPSVGIVGVFFDDQGMMYVNTTTASPESINYSREIDVSQKTSPVILKIDPQQGKILWSAEPGALVGYVSGKFIYTLDAYRSDLEGGDSYYAVGVETPSHVRIKRLNPKDGSQMWQYYEQRAPFDVQFDQNTIRMVFKKEVEVLKYIVL